MGGDIETITKSARALVERMIKAWVAVGGRALTADEIDWL